MRSNRLHIYFGVVGPWLSTLLLAQLSTRLGVAPSQLHCRSSASHCFLCPVLIVHGTEDRHTTIQEAWRLFAAAPTPKEFYALAGAAHVDLHAFGRNEYERRIGSFFARHLRTAN